MRFLLEQNERKYLIGQKHFGLIFHGAYFWSPPKNFFRLVRHFFVRFRKSRVRYIDFVNIHIFKYQKKGNRELTRKHCAAPIHQTSASNRAVLGRTAPAYTVVDSLRKTYHPCLLYTSPSPRDS